MEIFLMDTSRRPRPVILIIKSEVTGLWDIIFNVRELTAKKTLVTY